MQMEVARSPPASLKPPTASAPHATRSLQATAYHVWKSLSPQAELHVSWNKLVLTPILFVIELFISMTLTGIFLPLLEKL